MSHPTRGVWIETDYFHRYIVARESHTPRGVCGLKPGDAVPF